MNFGAMGASHAHMRTLAALTLLTIVPAAASGTQPVGQFEIDRTEVTIGQFRRFVEATGTSTRAEREGGGHVYEAGWVRKPGWTWRSPFGRPGADREPAVHVTFDEAQAYCRWSGKRLPDDAEWVEAAYTERRASPPAPFATGKTYLYPTGEHPAGANGLFDMGGNAWEWVDAGTPGERRTRGGSWWYGSAQMRADHVAGKAPDFAAVYIGFRCARDRAPPGPAASVVSEKPPEI